MISPFGRSLMPALSRVTISLVLPEVLEAIVQAPVIDSGHCITQSVSGVKPIWVFIFVDFLPDVG
jgi:hypothetical protein